MSIRMASVSGAYLNCIKRLNQNEYQNGFHIWSVSETVSQQDDEGILMTTTPKRNDFYLSINLS